MRLLLSFIFFLTPSSGIADPALTLIGAAPITVAPALQTGQGAGAVTAGISGLAFDPEAGDWLAVSDRDAHSIRRMRISLSPEALAAEVIALESVAPGGAANAEAITSAPGGAWIIAYESPASAVYFGPGFTNPRSLPGARDAASGLAPNRTWESISTQPTDPPSALLISEFGPPATPTDPARIRNARAVLLDIQTGRANACGVYPISPTPDFGGAGVTEIAAIDERRFLALERRITLRGYDAAVFLVELTRDGETLTMKKIPLGALRDLGVADPGNAEAMALGPRAADGSRPLIIINDDNLGRDGQRGARAIVLRFTE